LQQLVVRASCCFAAARHLVALASRGVAFGHDLAPLPLHRLDLGRDPIASRVRLLALLGHLTQPAGHLIQALRNLCLVSFEAIELTAQSAVCLP
jgi:hypothetical protein